MSENAQSKIGKLVTDPNEQRDAIHVAIIPVTAASDLSPGEPVRFCAGSTTHVRRANDGYTTDTAIGVVDPFLVPDPDEYRTVSAVKEGQRFYLWLYPNKVTGMRHNWEHPLFPHPKPMTQEEYEKAQVKKVLSAIHGDSEKFLRDYAAMLDCTYEKLLEAAKMRLDGSEEYIVTSGFDTPDRANTDIREFWRHFEIVTDIKVPGAKKSETFFSCSC